MGKIPVERTPWKDLCERMRETWVFMKSSKVVERDFGQEWKDCMVHVEPCDGCEDETLLILTMDDGYALSFVFQNDRSIASKNGFFKLPVGVDGDVIDVCINIQNPMRTVEYVRGCVEDDFKKVKEDCDESIL